MINVKDLENYIENHSHLGLSINMIIPLVNEYIGYNHVNTAIHTINTVWVHDGKIDYIIMSIHDTKDDSKYIVACDINDAYKSKINNIQVHQIDSDSISGFHFLESDYLITLNAIYNERKVINIDPSIYTKLLAIDDENTCFSEYYDDLAKFCSENFDLLYSIPLFEKSILFSDKNAYLVVFNPDASTEIHDKTKYIHIFKNKYQATEYMNYLLGRDNNAT